MNRRDFQVAICVAGLVSIWPAGAALSRASLSADHESNPIARVTIHTRSSLSNSGLFYAESNFRNRHRLRGRTVTAFAKLMENDSVLAVIEQRAGVNCRACGGSRKFASDSLQLPRDVVHRATRIDIDH